MSSPKNLRRLSLEEIRSLDETELTEEQMSTSIIKKTLNVDPKKKE